MASPAEGEHSPCAEEACGAGQSGKALLAASVAAQIEAQRTGPAAAATQPRYSYTFQMGDTWKATGKSGISHWIYGFSLRTDDPAYAELPLAKASAAPSGGGESAEVGGVGGVTIRLGRRYNDFEWLHRALSAEYPHVVVPGLPVLGIEGTLDKVNSLLWSEDYSALPRYRRYSLQLFLDSLARSPTLAGSPLLAVFAGYPDEDLVRLQKDWAKRTPHPTLLPSAWSSWPSLKVKVQSSLQSSLGTGKAHRALEPAVEKAKATATAEEEQLSGLKRRLETFWDNLVLLQQTSTAHTTAVTRENFPADDPVLSAILTAGCVVDQAVQALSPSNEELLLVVTAETEFVQGLCNGLRQVVAAVEQLTQWESLMTEHGMTSDPAYAKISEKLQEYNAAFTGQQLAVFAAMRNPVVHSLLTHFSEVVSVLDPVGFPWGNRCSAAIAAL
eukprot:RCo020420